VAGEKINSQVLNLGEENLVSRVEGGAATESAMRSASFQSSRLKPRLERLEREETVKRLWQKDATLWKREPDQQAGIKNSLGWLRVAEAMVERIDEMEGFAAEIKKAGFSHVVHMGMGGSSLAPLVFQRVFEPGPHGLPLIVLDTTDPASVHAVEQRVPVATTLFVVASKSGTTSEPLAFQDYFYERVRAHKGEKAGENFVAITDAGTPLEASAKGSGFRRTFLNFADIGGRYSALSYFGLLPAALMGLNLRKLLDEVLAMSRACTRPPAENHGALLGAVLGEMALSGKDKVTFLLPDELASLGMWLEQLMAESTGKEGTGLLPVTGEEAGGPLVYGDDRLFVCIWVKGRMQNGLEERMGLLQAASFPVVFIEMRERAGIVQEFFRWEVATAVAGAVLGINPFDQPNVQESKDATNRFLKGVQERGALTEPAPVMTHGVLSFFGRDGSEGPEALLWSFVGQARPGDYVSLQAYLPEGEETDRILQAIRLRLRDSLHVATTIGYGPRFLHSTGQYHKGGPDTGLFIQLTCSDAIDISIPGKSYTFGIFKKAQALGDLEALARHRRKVMRVDLGGDVRKGLGLLRRLFDGALAMRPG
jgi:transaldolase/glucose-6-phosphate isomerase